VVKKAPATSSLPAVRVSYESLVGLIGKGVGTPAVKAVLATAGKVRQTATHIVAHEAGFEFSLGRSPDEQVDTQPLVVLHLFAGHGRRHRTFADLPPPFIFGDRASLLAVAPRPARGQGVMTGRKQGLIPLDVPVASDTWKLGKLELTAHYRGDHVHTYRVMR
jgi:hypothetical protein